jgi:hypothetical protein
VAAVPVPPVRGALIFQELANFFKDGTRTPPFPSPEEGTQAREVFARAGGATDHRSASNSSPRSRPIIPRVAPSARLTSADIPSPATVPNVIHMSMGTSLVIGSSGCLLSPQLGNHRSGADR